MKGGGGKSHQGVRERGLLALRGRRLTYFTNTHTAVVALEGPVGWASLSLSFWDVFRSHISPPPPLKKEPDSGIEGERERRRI